MAEVVVTTRADADTIDILTHLGREAGKATAVRYGRRLIGLYDRLSAFPDIGATRPKLGPDIRILALPPYIVIYRHVAGSNKVSIIRVIHGSRDMTRRLLRPFPAPRNEGC